MVKMTIAEAKKIKTLKKKKTVREIVVLTGRTRRHVYEIFKNEKKTAAMERERRIASVVLSLRKRDPWRKKIGAILLHKEIPDLSRCAIQRVLNRCDLPGRLKPPFKNPYAGWSIEQKQSMTRTSRKQNWC
jgi:hypothetical protein